ncbi:MlaE family ABC transporter permease [Haliangium sp.]|uniref:MlaE family ABC transporter permease n=1 Tax=Haliangium sp. TaxID=2663208 RepID=UPI003D0A29EC
MSAQRYEGHLGPDLPDDDAGARTGAVAGMGASFLRLCRDTGGIVVLGAQVARTLVPLRLDGRQLLEHIHKMGNRSLAIVALTAFFAGTLLTMQSGATVRTLGATSLLGWGGGFAVFRELGPVLIALVFSGRVGTNNTAELGTMAITEQIDGLRALAIDPVRYLIAPRVLAMIIALLALTIIGNLIALQGGTLFAMLLFKVEFITLFISLADNLGPLDFLHGVVKSVAFGVAISLSSCYFGVSTRGGAVGVGRSVNAAVVSAAVLVILLDFILSQLLP